MGKRRRRAEAAIDEVRGRASDALAQAIDRTEELAGGAKRRTRKGRKRVERAARKAERKLGHVWNRGRLRTRQLRRRADRRIDRTAKKTTRGVKALRED